MKQTSKSPIGTSFHDCVVKATVNELKTVLGEPEYLANTGDGKVNYEWDMETETGDVFTVYDWKEYREIDDDEMIEWHIGGHSIGVTIQAQAELCTALLNLKQVK